jgi:putative phosphoribosyl transferase
VGAREACDALREIADDVVCVSMPKPFSSVGMWFVDFSQTTDQEVRQLLAAHRADNIFMQSAMT